MAVVLLNILSRQRLGPDLDLVKPAAERADLGAVLVIPLDRADGQRRGAGRDLFDEAVLQEDLHAVDKENDLHGVCVERGHDVLPAGGLDGVVEHAIWWTPASSSVELS